MNKYSKNIQTRIDEYAAFSASFFALIEQYEKIMIFAHRSPDFDAFGSQFGLGSFLKKHYPQKDIKIVGETNAMYNGGLYPLMDEVNENWFSAPFLALIIDTGNLDRVSDGRYKKAHKIVKIDHHPDVEPFGDLSLVDTKAVAVSEILTVLFLGTNKEIPLESSNYLFSGIVGDSGRFKYASTTALSFSVAEQLINNGVNINEVYNELYAVTLQDLATNAYILNNYKITPNGFAYYLIDNATLEKLGISVERGKESVNIFSGVIGVKAWAAITEDKANNYYRVSIRSAKKPINHIAAKWNGGGHVQASGATIYHYEDIAVFVNEMDEYLGKKD